MTEFPIIQKPVKLICRANQWTGFYMVGNSVMKELNDLKVNDSISISAVFQNLWTTAPGGMAKNPADI